VGQQLPRLKRILTNVQTIATSLFPPFEK